MENFLPKWANFRNITLVSLAFMLCFMLFTSKEFGISGDEMTQNTYGQLVYEYYSSFGKVRKCFEPFGRIDNAFYYGGFYDLLCVTVNKFSPFDPFDTRHFINAFFGFLIIFFAAKFAKYLKGWDAALLVSWLLFLSPRFLGECMNNPKDVPYALGMLIGVYYIVRFIKAFPKPSKMDFIKLILSIAFAISIRVGGILLIPYFGLAFIIYFIFEWRKNKQFIQKDYVRYILSCAGVCAAGYLLGLVFWPFGIESPIANPLKALGEMSNFGTPIPMLFDDNKILSLNVPWYYIPKWITISTPLIVLLGIFISPYLFFSKKFSNQQIFFLFFVSLFPLIYIIQKKSPLYDGWRHLFFIFPPLVLLASLVYITILEKIKSKYGKYAMTAILVIGLLMPAKWCIANHPNETVYFNELAGGIDGAYGHFETDYYMNSVKQATLKLAKKYDLYNTKDTIVIASNAIEPVIHYFSRINPKIVCVYIRYYQRYEKKWDYALIYTRFLDKDILKNENGESNFPPANTIDIIKADNTPLCAIVKADPEQAAYKANEFLKTNKFDSAIVWYERALAKDKNDETSLFSYAIALASTGRLQESINIMNRRMKITPNDAQCFQIMGKLYNAVGDKAKAQQANSRAQELIEKERGE